MNQTELFKTYPFKAGHQRVDTSIAAAEDIEKSGRASDYRTKVLDLFKAGGDYNADEVAHILGVDVLTVRSRVTELVKQERLEDTGDRRSSSRGKPSRVYRIREQTDEHPYTPGCDCAKCEEFYMWSIR